MRARTFCRRVAKRLPRGTSRELVASVFGAILEEAREILQEGDEWRLPGFGVFSVEVDVEGPYLSTEELVEGKTRPEHRRIHFEPHTEFQRYINGESHGG